MNLMLVKLTVWIKWNRYNYR